MPTPALDRVAAEGLRYTRFHTTALCSPTRAALLDGPQPSLREHRRHHRGRDRATTATPASSARTSARSPRCCASTATRRPGSARTTTRPTGRPARSARSIAGRAAWASTTSTASWAATWTSGSRPCTRTTNWCRARAIPNYILTTDLVDRVDRLAAPHARHRRREAVLPLHVHRRHACAASRVARVHRHVQGPVRRGLGRLSRADVRAAEEAGRGAARRAADEAAGRAAGVEFAVGRSEAAVRPHDGSVRGASPRRPTTKWAGCSRSCAPCPTPTTRSSSTRSATTAPRPKAAWSAC